MGSVYRDRFDDSRSTISRRDDGKVTKVTRYTIREQDDDARSVYTTRSRREPEEPRRQTEYVERDLVVRTREEASRSPRPQYYERDYRDDHDDREVIIRRTVEHNEPRREERDLTVTKVEERREEPRHEMTSARDPYWERDRDLQHYTRTAEYYGPSGQQQPQTIIIRQDPIIIRERVRDDDYQLVRRSDAEEERSVVRREDPRDEEYFYEKRVRERIEDPRDDRRRDRRELSPGDSVSQVGRRRDRSYSSDDSMVYVRKVREGYDSREGSPDRKKNLAAGVIAGVGAAELLRSHRRKEGHETSHGIGRIGRDVGAGAIGALAAEGISRARSMHRDRSRRRHSRSRSYSSERGDRHGRSRSRSRRRRSRSRSRSRSASHSRLKTLGALGLGAAAVAAAATIASKKMQKNKEEPERRRSRSRQRRGSVESLEKLENDPAADDARNPKHRASRIAAAGAVGAAGAALIERARNHHRDRSRSQSRIRQGLPIVAAGLGTAALAGLVEKNKAKREAEKIQVEQKREAREDRRRSRSRAASQTRSESGYYGEGPPQQLGHNPNVDRFIEYGDGPMYGNNFGPGYYGQAPPQEPYYNAQAMVPAEVPHGGPREARARSLSRDRRGTRSISPGSETERSRRRDMDGIAAAGAAAGAAGALAHEEQRKQERRDRKARRREQERGYGNDPYEDGYGAQNFNTATPPPAHDPYAFQPYNNATTSQFEPPPGSLPQQYPAANMPHGFGTGAVPQPVGAAAAAPGTYQPPQNNTFGAPPAFNAPPAEPYGGQTFSSPNVPPTQTFDPAYAPGANQYGTPRNRGAEENVSAGSASFQPHPSDQHDTTVDGVNPASNTTHRPPSINIIPPSANDTAPPSSSSIPNLTIPPNYVPPNNTYAEKGFDTPHEQRHVQFAPPTESTRSTPGLGAQATDSEAISPDDRRHRRHRNETNQGYEASEDTDTSPADDPRSRAYDMRAERERVEQMNRSRSSSQREREGNRPRDGDRDRNRDRRDRDKDRDRDVDGDRDGRRSSRKNRSGGQGQSDGNDSDATIELAPRFDEKGRKKPERGEDPLADKIEDIIAGKGTAGKAFGNFMDGLMGGNGDQGKGPGQKK